MVLRKLNLLEQSHLLQQEDRVAIKQFLVPLYGRYNYLIRGLGSAYAAETIEEAYFAAQKLVATEERNGLHTKP